MSIRGWFSIVKIASMSGPEGIVNGFPAPKTILGGVPKSDAGLTQFPAQTHFPILEKGKEIDQSDVQVLDLRAQFADGFKRGLQGSRAAIAARAHAEKFCVIDSNAPGHTDSLRFVLQFIVRALSFRLVIESVPQQALHFGQVSFRLIEREVARHR